MLTKNQIFPIVLTIKYYYLLLTLSIMEKNYWKFAEQTRNVLEALDCYWGFFGERTVNMEDPDEMLFYPNGFFTINNPETDHLQVYDNRCRLIADDAFDFHGFENGYYALSVEKKESYQFYNPQGELIACYDDVLYFGKYRHFVLRKDDKLFVLPIDDLSQSRAIGSVGNIVKFWDADDGKIAIYQNYGVVLYDKDFCKIHLIPNIICVDFFASGNFIVWTEDKGILYDTNLIPLLDNLDVDYRWLVSRKMCRNKDATYDCLTATPVHEKYFLPGAPNCEFYVSKLSNVYLHLGNGEQFAIQEDDKPFVFAKKFIGLVRQDRLLVLALDLPLQQQKMLFDAFIRKVPGEDISDALFDYGQKFISLVKGDKLNKREILRYLLSH